MHVVERERSMTRATRWLVLVGVWSVLSLATARGAEMSPLNLSPGFPTLLDDAYPVNTQAVVTQPSLYLDKTDDGKFRLNQSLDIRWGVAHGMELVVGRTNFHGQLSPGAMNDPRAVRGGFLYRSTRQPGAGELAPSLAIRTTVQVPVNAPQTEPALRADLLASWDLTHQFWGHLNMGYQVAPGGEPGLQAPGRNAVWYGRAGVVTEVWRDVGLVASVTYTQDYTQRTGYVTTPEMGCTYGIAPDWILMLGVGRDFGASDTKAVIRGNIGFAKVW